ncbi:MAG TPA: acetate--CoA ligase family protein [Methylomirabilota bacterium]|nr:acetate--CoA ligase family protein [Methylomirabilota bacterium]
MDAEPLRPSLPRSIDLAPLLRPRSVAVLGASDRPSPGRMVIESLDRIGFTGPIYPVNPKYETLFGRTCYPSIADLPEAVDVLALCVNHTRVLEHIRPAARRGVRAAIIFDGGFAERGDEGRRRQEELVAICREAGIALCGPNCMGVVSPHARSLVYIQTLADPTLLAGNVGLISQSGSLCIGLLADCRRFGFSHVISSGNEAVLTAVDYLEYLIDDPATKVIALFLETVRQPDRFVAALDRAADQGKPVVVLKVGRSERARSAITSHTGGLAGEARVFSTVLRAHRAIEVGDVDEMAEVLACCQGARWPRGRRVAVMTASGGQAELILDLASAAGLDLPPLPPSSRAEMQHALGTLTGDGNPLDAWGNGDYATNFPRAISALGADPGYDVVVFCSDSFDDQPFGTPERLLAYARIVSEGAARSPKPFYYMTTRSGIFRRDVLAFLREHDIPVIGGTRQGLGAIDRLARWSVSPPARPAASRRSGRLATMLAAGPRASIHEHDAKRLLAEAGMPIPDERLVPGLAEARAAASTLGYPVVLKVVSDDIPHRSELGLVAVGLQDESQLVDAYERMNRRLEERGQRAGIAGFLVQPVALGGLEVFAGVSTDPDFGPILAFGAGGVLVEALDDVALRALPLRDGDAEAMIAETRAGTLLGGYRGRPPGDVAALARCLSALADFAWAERGSIAEIDVNPIVVQERGYAIVDALIVPRPAP